MDFSKIDVGAPKKKAQKTAFDVAVTTAEGQPFLNGAGQPLKVKLLAMNSPEGEEEMRRWRIKYAVGKDKGDLSTADEQTIAKLAEQDKASSIELIARMTVDWNVSTPNGDKVEPTRDNRFKFYEVFPDVLEAVSAEVQRIVADLGNSKAT